MKPTDDDFQNIFREYMALLDEYRSEASVQEHDLHERMIDLLLTQGVSVQTVIESFAEAFNKYPKLRHLLLLLMGDISDLMEETIQYRPQEFFWIIVKSGWLGTVRIYDVMRSLAKLAGRELIRSYLNFLLITSESIESRDIVRSYYYVGHDIESLKIVTDLVPLNEDTLVAYRYVFWGIVRFLFDQRELSGSQQQFLSDLVTRGLDTEDEHIVTSCRKSLELLNQR